jgi:hypothetical protein
MLLMDGEPPTREAHVVDRVDNERAIGWERKPDGLCCAEVCVPVPSGALDLRGVARALGRPLVTDSAIDVAAMGAAPESRGMSLLSGQAPDFTLKDLAGKEWALSRFAASRLCSTCTPGGEVVEATGPCARHCKKDSRRSA